MMCITRNWVFFFYIEKFEVKPRGSRTLMRCIIEDVLWEQSLYGDKSSIFAAHIPGAI